MKATTTSRAIYLLMDGTEVTKEQIRESFEAGMAVLVHYWKPSGSTGSALMLHGRHHDTRGDCYSVWEETWTTTPETLEQALNVASCYV